MTELNKYSFIIAEKKYPSLVILVLLRYLTMRYIIDNNYLTLVT